MTVTYLYGIVAANASIELGPIGIPDGSTPVVGLAVDGLVALGSEYHGPSFADLPKDQLLRLLIVHQQVLETVIGKYPVLPARFGTTVASQDEATLALHHFGPRLRAALDDIGQAVEVDLSATWDLPEVLKGIGALPSQVEVRGQSDDQSQDPLAMQLRIGRLVQEQVDQRRDQYRRRVVGELVRHARDAQPNPRPSEDIVFNLAFLVDRSELPAFDAAVDRIGEELDGQLSLRYVGPLPPYSFGTVALSRPDAEKVRAAVHLLGLPDSATRAQVQEAYRRTAARLHPDVNREDPLAQERFAELGDTYTELTRYLDGIVGDDSEVDGSEYHLSDRAIRGSILMQLLRDTPAIGDDLGGRHESPIGA